jgi:hypothetical protein
MMRIRPLRSALALLLVLSCAASGQGGQLFLNVYLDDASSQKVLVVGSVDDPSGLSFLDSSRKIQEEGGQIYAICDSLVEKSGSGWTLTLTAKGYYDEYHAAFFISGGSDFTKINATDGLQFLSTSYNGTLILDVQGVELNDPSVTFSYVAA